STARVGPGGPACYWPSAACNPDAPATPGSPRPAGPADLASSAYSPSHSPPSREHDAPYPRLLSAPDYADTSTGQTTSPTSSRQREPGNRDPRHSCGVGIDQPMRMSA